MRSLRSILLTGGAGFIGSTLARHLLAEEELERLVALDRPSPSANRGNLIGPDHDPRFHFVEGDILDRDAVARLLHEHAVTGVFHLAAESPPEPPGGNAVGLVHTNVTGTALLLEACRAARIPLLQCSTTDVYGSIDPPGRFTERSPLQPSTPGAASKAAADLLCLAAGRTHRQDVVITRSSTTYGPRMRADSLVPTLVRHALHDEPLPLAGDGMTIRDWIHVDDHCRGLLAAYREAKRGAVHLFGGQCERTDLGVARDVLQVLGKPERLLALLPDQPAPDRRSAVDVGRSVALFGWRPERTFKRFFPGVVRELAANWNAAY